MGVLEIKNQGALSPEQSLLAQDLSARCHAEARAIAVPSLPSSAWRGTVQA
jgi:hypothetical protein